MGIDWMTVAESAEALPPQRAHKYVGQSPAGTESPRWQTRRVRLGLAVERHRLALRRPCFTGVHGAEKQQEKRCTGPCKRMCGPLKFSTGTKPKRPDAQADAELAVKCTRVAVYDAENHEAKLERLRGYHNAGNWERERERLRERHKEHGYPDKRPFLYSDQHGEEEISAEVGWKALLLCGSSRRRRGPWTDDDCCRFIRTAAQAFRLPTARQLLGLRVAQCHRPAHRQADAM